MAQTETNSLTEKNSPDADWQIVTTEANGNVAAETQTFEGLVDAIESTMARARNAAARHVCIDQLLAYWNPKGRSLWQLLLRANGAR